MPAVSFGRLKEAIEDGEKAIEIVRLYDVSLTLRAYSFVGLHYECAGNPKQATAIYLKQVYAAGTRGWLFSGYRSLSRLSIQMGDLG